MTQTIEQLQAKVAELEAENELLKGRKNVELAANTDNAKSKQQRELAGPMEMGQLLAGSTHKTSGDLEIERTKPVTWIHKGGGFISDSRGKFIGCFSGDFRYRDRIICAINSESETSNQLAAEQLNNKLLRDALNQWIGIAANCSIESGCCGCGESIENHSHPMICGHSPVDMADSVVREAIDSTDKALSHPASTEALDAYVAEKVKEAGKFDMWKTNPYTKVLETSIEQLTKQRDLAVEALEKIAAPVRGDGTYNRCREACEILARETLSAIKESEAK